MLKGLVLVMSQVASEWFLFSFSHVLRYPSQSLLPTSQNHAGQWNSPNIEK